MAYGILRPVRKMRKSGIWILLVVVLVAAAGGAWWWLDGPIAVSVVTPTRGPAVDAIYATGTVEPTVMLPIAPRVAGRLVELNVDEGNRRPQGAGARAPRRRRSREHRRGARGAGQVRAIAVRARARTSCARASWRRRRSTGPAPISTLRVAAVKRARSQRDYMALVGAGRWPDHPSRRRDRPVHSGRPGGVRPVVLRAASRNGRGRRRGHRPRACRAEGRAARRCAAGRDCWTATVSEITPKGDPVARSYRVRIKLAEPGRAESRHDRRRQPDRRRARQRAARTGDGRPERRRVDRQRRTIAPAAGARRRHRRRPRRNRRGAHAGRARRRLARVRLARGTRASRRRAHPKRQ